MKIDFKKIILTYLAIIATGMLILAFWLKLINI
jgi:hypothetical protein